MENNTAGLSGFERAKKDLSGVRSLVVGLGATGASVSRFLKKCGSVVTATDMKPLSALPDAKALSGIGVNIVAGGLSGGGMEEAALIVVSPGVPSGHPVLADARKRGAEIISDIELAYRYMDCPVLAIAGTNGKTTTTALLGKVFEDAGKKVFVGGNIGTPAVEYVEGGGGADFCVLEISSFHLETTKTFRPHIGVLLNITEDHLDRYRDFGHYAGTKFRLFENQTPGDYAVINMNDPTVKRWSEGGACRGRTVPFTVSGELEEGLFLRGGSIIYRTGISQESYPAASFRLKGLHNMENIMAVIACARLSGISRETILKTLSAFEGLSHRMELVRELRGVRYIDDSKGTNIGALEMALRGLSGNVILIAGGRDKGGDYRVIGGLVRDKVKLMVLIGEARFKIKEALGGAAENMMAGSFEEAVRAASARALPGDTVLLCPACSSFDMFNSYKERGDRFKELVRAL